MFTSNIPTQKLSNSQPLQRSSGAPEELCAMRCGGIWGWAALVDGFFVTRRKRFFSIVRRFSFQGGACCFGILGSIYSSLQGLPGRNSVGFPSMVGISVSLYSAGFSALGLGTPWTPWGSYKGILGGILPQNFGGISTHCETRWSLLKLRSLFGYLKYWVRLRIVTPKKDPNFNATRPASARPSASA